MARAYGVLDEANGWARRVTFVIDREGVIREVIEGAAALETGPVLAALERIEKKGPSGSD